MKQAGLAKQMQRSTRLSLLRHALDIREFSKCKAVEHSHIRLPQLKEALQARAVPIFRRLCDDNLQSAAGNATPWGV